MTKRLLAIDGPVLEDATRILETRTTGDTVTEALRRVTRIESPTAWVELRAAESLVGPEDAGAMGGAWRLADAA